MHGDRGFIPRLEALRGIAAVLVGVYHCGAWFMPFPPTGISRLYYGAANGMGCVVVFFVISGFVLARSLDRGASLSLLAFSRGRLFRLLPASVVVVGLLAILHQKFGFFVGFEGDFSPFNIALNMLLLKSDINGVMWSLTVELVATPFIFLATLGYRKLGPLPLVLTVALLFGLSFIGPYVHLIGANLAPLYAFVVGVLVHFEGRRFAALVPERLAPAMALSGLGLFYVAGLMKPTAPMILLDCIAGALLVFSIVQWPQLRILGPLDYSPVRFFGRVSYSFYLLNPMSVVPAIYLFDSFLQQLGPMAHAAALSVVTTLLTAVPAYLCYRFVEVPGISLGRAVSRPNRTDRDPLEPDEARSSSGDAAIGREGAPL
jgi:peptidoglycan/LPS O-acetylase OafA/YrhL